MEKRDLIRKGKIMHEMGVTRNLVDIVVAQAEARKATEVHTVYLHIGFVRDIVDSILEECFRWMARDTVAANADLIIERIPFTVRCNDCGTIFPIDAHNEETWICPACEAKNYSLNSGTEFFISGIEMALPEDHRVCA